MDIEPLLQPISAEAPCGEDLSYDAGFNELEGLAKGKEAKNFSGSDDPEWQVAAEEPDWKLLRDRCTELFARSKDLRLAAMLALALLKLEGLPGLRDGLTLLQRLVSEQWEGIYPRLDPEDNNDPTERVNIIAGLSKPLGAYGDPVRFIERIRTTPLSNSAQMGRFSLAQITQVGLPAGSETTAPAPEQVEAAFRDSSPDDLAVIATAASESRNIVSELDSKLMELVGANQAPSLEELKAVLGEVQQNLAPYLPQDSPAALEAAEAAAAPTASRSAGSAPRQAGTQAASFTGAITSRADVSRAIDEICAYYQQAEPGHPVPLLLRRAQRLVDKDFLALMEDLLPDSLAPLGNLIGQKRDGESVPALEELPSE